jgi:hypothetical protein
MQATHSAALTHPHTHAHARACVHLASLFQSSVASILTVFATHATRAHTSCIHTIFPFFGLYCTSAIALSLPTPCLPVCLPACLQRPLRPAGAGAHLRQHVPAGVDVRWAARLLGRRTRAEQPHLLVRVRRRGAAQDRSPWPALVLPRQLAHARVLHLRRLHHRRCALHARGRRHRQGTRHTLGALFACVCLRLFVFVFVCCVCLFAFVCMVCLVVFQHSEPSRSLVVLLCSLSFLLRSPWPGHPCAACRTHTCVRVCVCSCRWCA